MMYKKAQESRNDMFVWYVVCFALVFITIGSLYGFGVIGNYNGPGSLSENAFTSAAVTNTEIPEEGPLEIASDENVSSSSGDE